ncbi:sporulation inhibitor of replication protein SirA [Alkalihalobacterium alkalinitrilicum]|uniref:sporulation inhibitor of replication protein SirA n=1 Tax=Alkalihalobacterium alkalinitrilicum TaxID=427920 RepID=UPI0009956E54|nr:sporulation inhibitor of replication protein SirA [Alkalihalobacterium alkalinitrilicum]
MRKYDIYLINGDVSQHYFGQESKLFHLFLDEIRAADENKAIIKKQIKYISNPIPVVELQHRLLSSFKHRTDYFFFDHTHRLQISEPFSKAQMFIFPDYIHLVSEGSYEAETMFFEVMRKLSPSFFALDVSTYRYGWLNPIKQVKLV